MKAERKTIMKKKYAITSKGLESKCESRKKDNNEQYFHLCGAQRWQVSQIWITDEKQMRTH